MEEKNIKTATGQFSPFTDVTVSPVSKAKQLTGNVRIIRDSVAELHGLIQHWNGSFLEGVAILKKINSTNLDCKSIFDDARQELCDELQKTVENLENITLGMRDVIHHVKSMGKLYTGRHLFFAWPMEKFENLCEKIYQVYKSEVTLKRLISENVAHCKSEIESIIYLATWTHESNIQFSLMTDIQSMLVETSLM